MIKSKFQYILVPIAWCIIYTIANIIKDKDNFLSFMQTQQFFYNLILYFILGLIVTYLVELRNKKRDKKR